MHIRQHLVQENAGADAWFAQTEQLQSELLEELRGRVVPVEDTLPDADGPWLYFWRYKEGDDYGAFVRKRREGKAEQVLLDSEFESQGHDYYDDGEVAHSPDHRYLAWGADTSGDEHFELRIRDLDTGIDEDAISGVYQVCWGNATTLFYTRIDENLRPSKLYRHCLGDNPQDDVLVFEEKDVRFHVSVWTTQSKDWLIIDSAMTDCNEQRLIPCSDVMAVPVVVEARTPGLQYWLEHQNDRFIILSNVDGAADYCIAQSPVESPARTHWKIINEHQPGRMLLDVEVLGDWLIVLQRKDGLPQIVCHHRDGRVHELAFAQQAYNLSVDTGLEFNASSFRFTYDSPTTPEQDYEFMLESRDRILLKERVIPSGHDPDQYIVQRVFIPSHDAVNVPVTLVYRKDTRLDGTAPSLVYGYGAYGYSTEAEFSSPILSLLDRGFVHVLAHVRGGQELGRAWYEAGRLEYKQNSFEDLYAILQHLVEQKVLASGRIVLQGGSAGGLLVAATMDLCVQRSPELLAGVIAEVPFVDVLNTMLDASLPSTPSEWSEWGDPITDAKARTRLRDYAPYEQVGAYPYPALYVTAGVSDPRVAWWEPAKWVARLRQHRSNAAPLLLKTNMNSGHFGQTGRYGALEDLVLELAFAIRVTGAEQTVSRD